MFALISITVIYICITFRYTPEYHPVLAFTGAPGQFPIQKAHVGLHKYLQWSDSMARQRDDFIQQELGEHFIGIHLRLGSDFVRVRNISFTYPYRATVKKE